MRGKYKVAWYTYTDKQGKELTIDQCGICATTDSEDKPHYAKGLCESCYQKWVRGGQERYPDFKPTDIIKRIKKSAHNNGRHCAFCDEPEATMIFGTSLCDDHIAQYKALVTGKQAAIGQLFMAAN